MTQRLFLPLVYVSGQHRQCRCTNPFNKQPEEKYKIESKLPILYEAMAENYKAAKNYEKYGEALQTEIALKDLLY